MENKLVTDYMLDNDFCFSERDEISVTHAGEYLIVDIYDGYNTEKIMLPFLAVIAWVYSKVDKGEQ